MSFVLEENKYPYVPRPRKGPKADQTKEAKALILATALKIAEERGYNKVCREEIVALAGLSGVALVSHHFGTVKQLQRAIIGAAIAQGNQTVIAQGLVMGDKRARALSLKAKKLAILHAVQDE